MNGYKYSQHVRFTRITQMLKAFSIQSTKEILSGALREALRDADPSVLPLS